jgi:hypothetical protein
MRAAQIAFALITIVLTVVAFTSRLPSRPGEPGYVLAVAVVALWIATIVWTVAEFYRVGTGSAGCLLLTFIGMWVILIAPLALIFLAFQPSQRVCPACEMTVRGRVERCPFCDADLSAGRVLQVEGHDV